MDSPVYIRHVKADILLDIQPHCSGVHCKNRFVILTNGKSAFLLKYCKKQIFHFDEKIFHIQLIILIE